MAGDRQIAFLNGQWVDARSACVPIWDLGFTQGVIVSEQIRTFAGQPHLVSEHLARFSAGLKSVGIPAKYSLQQMKQLVMRLVRSNYVQDDLGVCLFATPGASENFAPDGVELNCSATLGLHSYRLPVERWREIYARGLSLVTVPTRQIPRECLPRSLKCRSRMHYWLAECQARQLQPESRALLLDTEGKLAEGSTAAIALVHLDEAIVAPPEDQILPSISLQFSSQLVHSGGIQVIRRAIQPDELRTADEVLWFSTPQCVLPVTRIDNCAIGSGQPGPVFHRLMSLWSDAVGMDIVGQSLKRHG